MYGTRKVEKGKETLASYLKRGEFLDRRQTGVICLGTFSSLPVLTRAKYVIIEEDTQVIYVQRAKFLLLHIPGSSLMV